MTDRQAIEKRLVPVLGWLAGTRTVSEAIEEYWDIRRRVMATETIANVDASWLMHDIDTAMDSFDPDPDLGLAEIDEPQLRIELTVALAGLRALGFVD